MSDKIDPSCNSPKLVDQIGMLLLEDSQKGRQRIDECDLTYAANKALDMFKLGDTVESVKDKAYLFQATAHSDLTEQAKARAAEIWASSFIINHLNHKR